MLKLEKIGKTIKGTHLKLQQCKTVGRGLLRMRIDESIFFRMMNSTNLQRLKYFLSEERPV